VSTKPDLNAAIAACMASPVARPLTPLPLSDHAQDQAENRGMAREPGPATLKNTRSQIHAVDGLQVYRTEFPDPVFAVDGLLTNGVTLLAARPKQGKSWLGLQVAVAVATGQKVLDRFSAGQGRVLYCGLEESERRTNARLHKLVEKEEISLQNLNFVYQLPILVAGGYEALDAYLAANHCDLVVIDTLLAVVRPGPRDVLRSDYAEVNLLRKLAEKHHTAILVICHTRKLEAKYPLDAVAGTSGVTAACDAVWVLEKLQNGNSRLSINGRDMEEQVLEMRFDKTEPFGWKLVAEGSDVGLTKERRDIVDLLRSGPLSPHDIALGLGKNASTTRRLIQKLAADGLLMKNSEGEYQVTATNRGEETPT
jgi:predicted transcriptional regulator